MIVPIPPLQMHWLNPQTELILLVAMTIVSIILLFVCIYLYYHRETYESEMGVYG